MTDKCFKNENISVTGNTNTNSLIHEPLYSRKNIFKNST